MVHYHLTDKTLTWAQVNCTMCARACVAIELYLAVKQCIETVLHFGWRSSVPSDVPNIFQLAVTYLTEADLMSSFSNMSEDISCGCRKDVICCGAFTHTSSAHPLRCLALWRQPKRNTVLKTTLSARYRWSRCSSALPSSSTARTAGGCEVEPGSCTAFPAPQDCALDTEKEPVEEHCNFYCCVVLVCDHWFIMNMWWERKQSLVLICQPCTELHLLVNVGSKVNRYYHTSQFYNRVFLLFICVQLFFVIFILISDFSKIIF